MDQTNKRKRSSSRKREKTDEDEDREALELKKIAGWREACCTGIKRPGKEVERARSNKISTPKLKKKGRNAVASPLGEYQQTSLKGEKKKLERRR